MHRSAREKAEQHPLAVAPHRAAFCPLLCPPTFKKSIHCRKPRNEKFSAAVKKPAKSCATTTYAAPNAKATSWACRHRVHNKKHQSAFDGGAGATAPRLASTPPRITPAPAVLVYSTHLVRHGKATKLYPLVADSVEQHNDADKNTKLQGWRVRHATCNVVFRSNMGANY